MHKLRSTLLGVVTTAVVVAAIPATASATPTAASTAVSTTSCPGTFSVLHDDRIGTLKLPAGPYAITASGVTCSQASTLFTRFLQDWDGVLPGGWTVKGSGFARGGASFTVTPAATPPTPPPPSGQTCPGQFTLRNNDKIGALSLPKGNYVIQLLKKGGSLSCDAADREFALFLTKNDTAPLPAPWKLDATTATFTSTGGIGFKVVKGTGGTGGGGSTTGIKCPSTFRVVHADRIGKLAVKAGSYWIYAIGALTCKQVTADFKQALDLGRVPNANWKLDASTATFLFLKTKGYRVEPVKGV